MEKVTDGVKGSCSCEYPQHVNFPCDHLVAHAIKIGVDVASLVAKRDTTAQWQLQFQLGGTFSLPDTAGLEVDETVHFPLYQPRRRGAPKKGRYKGECYAAILTAHVRTARALPLFVQYFENIM